VKIALVHVASPTGESVSERRVRVAESVQSAKGVDLIVLPELWAVGYFAFSEYAMAAEPLDGPTVTDAGAWARATGAYVHAGSFVERAEDGRVYNTAVLLDPSGVVVHIYRKVHVFGYDSLEADLIAPGDAVPVASTPFGVVGATTCYDLRFPELWRALVDQGCEIAVTPAAWPQARLNHWQLFTSVRAVENQMFVIACNAVGVQGEVVLGGHSKVVDPWGTVLAETGDEEGVTVVDLDPSVVRAQREAFPALGDRQDWLRRDVTTETAVLDAR
jgi:predicted amidohydrolase